MNWDINATEFSVSSFGMPQPSETLYDFDGPRIFTATSTLGELLYFLADEDAQVLRFIVAPTSALVIQQLKTGISSVRDALDQPWLWVVDTSLDMTPQRSWRCTLTDIPSEVLPKPGVMLWPHLEPIFALRAIGDGLSRGNVPASVIRQVIDGATTALKKISSRVLESNNSLGRKTNYVRQFYDLPAQGFAYNSFEIAFKLPDAELLTRSDANPNEPLCQEFQEIGSQLQTAIQWALEKESHTAEPSDIDLDLLEALEKLVPRQSGVVESIEVRGRIFSSAHERYSLTRESTKRVSCALSKARATQERICQVSGLIPEMDKDNFTFTLRDTSDGRDHCCNFPPELIDEVLLAFNTDKRVTVSGRETLGNGNIDVSLIASSENQSSKEGYQ